jgi:leucyl-tRNA synthetase
VLALILNPFAPHLSEECYSLICGNDDDNDKNNSVFASIARWPSVDEDKIDIKLHYLEELVNATIKDIRSVLELAKIENPKEIEIIISEEWKYEFYSKVRELVNGGTRNVSELSKHIMNSELKKHGQEIMKVLPKIVDKLPEYILDQKSELDAFLTVRVDLSAEFKCDVKITNSEHSKEAKAKQASPGKPAIVVR